MRVIIVGGGVGGLTTAIALNQTGIEAHVYEQAKELREVGAGIGIAANALHALDALGLGTPVRSQSIAGVQGGLRDPKGRALVAIPANEMTQELGSVAVMHRAELLSLLVQQIEPDRLHLSQTFVQFEQNSERIAVRFQSGEMVRGDVLVAADGLRSVARSQMFGSVRLRYAGYTAWRAVVPFDHNRDLMMGETWGRGCRFGIVPMSGGRIYWFATKNTGEGDRDREGDRKAALLRLFQGWPEPIEALIAAANEEAILRNNIYDMDPLPRFVEGRAALLGDAAHAMTPNLGQGACQAMEDAVVLAACLKKHDSVERGLLEYERRRAPRTREVVLRSRRLGTVAQFENPAVCWLRNVVMKATPGHVAARQMKSMLSFSALDESELKRFRG